MNPRAVLLALLAVAACGGGPTAVELRLYPCAPPAGAAMSVTLEIQSRDQGGAALGDPLAKTFEISDPAVLSDGYATVGFEPPAGTVTADFAVTWKGGLDESTAHYMNVAVPALGEAIVLGMEACEDVGGTTGDPTSGTSGSTADATTNEGTSTGASSTGSTGGTSSGSTGETTGDATGTTGTTGDTDTTGGTTGGDEPKEGLPCEQGEPAVCDGGPGALGTFLQCIDSVWTKSEPPCDVETVCPIELGLVAPQLIGCLGEGTNWTCGCADTPVMECAMGDMNKCSPIAGGFKIDLCVDEGGKSIHYAGRCNDCYDVQGEPLCVQ